MLVSRAGQGRIGGWRRCVQEAYPAFFSSGYMSPTSDSSAVSTLSMTAACELKVARGVRSKVRRSGTDRRRAAMQTEERRLKIERVSTCSSHLNGKTTDHDDRDLLRVRRLRTPLVSE